MTAISGIPFQWLDLPKTTFLKEQSNSCIMPVIRICGENTMKLRKKLGKCPMQMTLQVSLGDSEHILFQIAESSLLG